MTFNKKSKIRVGIDLGVRTICVSVAEDSKVVQLAMYEDPRDPDPNAVNTDNDILFEWLHLYVQENGLEGHPAVINVPGERMVILPATIEPHVQENRALKELAEHSKLTSYIPFEDPVFTFWKYKVETEVKKHGAQETWLAAIPSQAISYRSKKIRETGLEPEWIEPDLAGLARILVKDSKHSQVILDIGELNTQLALVKNNRVVYYRTLDLGVVSLIQPLFDLLDGNFYKTFHVVRQHAEGTNSNPAVEQLVSPVLDRFWGEVSRTISIYGERCGLNQVADIILLGGGSLLVSKEQASKITGLNVKNLQFERDLVIDNPLTQTMEYTEEELSYEPFYIAMGCSLSPPNEPASLHFKPTKKPLNWKAIGNISLSNPFTVAASIFILSLLVHTIFKIIEGSTVEATNRLQQEIDNVDTDYNEVATRLEEVRKLKGKVDLTHSLKERSFLHSKAIASILTSLSSGIRIQSLDINNSEIIDVAKLRELQRPSLAPELFPKFVLVGSADGPTAAKNFSEVLRNNKNFANITLSDVKRDGNFGISFTVKGTVVKTIK